MEGTHPVGQSAASRQRPRAIHLNQQERGENGGKPAQPGRKEKTNREKIRKEPVKPKHTSREGRLNPWGRCKSTSGGLFSRDAEYRTAGRSRQKGGVEGKDAISSLG